MLLGCKDCHFFSAKLPKKIGNTQNHKAPEDFPEPRNKIIKQRLFP